MGSETVIPDFVPCEEKDNSGLSYVLGRSCWHVVSSDVYGYYILCNPRNLREPGPGGNSTDVVRSEIDICKSCNRRSNNQAEQERMRTWEQLSDT